MLKNNFSPNGCDECRRPFITAKKFMVFNQVRKLNSRENLYIISKTEMISCCAYGKATPFTYY